MELVTLTTKLTNVGAGSGSVSGSETITANSALSSTPAVAGGTYDLSIYFPMPFANIQMFYAVSNQPLTLKFDGTDEVQSVTITGTPTGGTFTLTFGGQTTAAIPYNAVAGAVQASLVAISSIGAGGVTVTGGPLPGTPLAVKFVGPRGKANQAAMTFTGSLTGGTSPTVVIAETTAGASPSKTITLAAGVPAQWSVNSPLFTNPFASNVTNVYATNTGTAQATLSLRALTN